MEQPASFGVNLIGVRQFIMQGAQRVEQFLPIHRIASLWMFRE